MQPLAHTENTIGQLHYLSDHLQSVGELACRFLAEGNAELAEFGRWAGLLHDLGKYRAEFQEYLRGQRAPSDSTHHAVYGAALAFKRKCVPIAFAIAGHHRGLQDADDLRTMIGKPAYDALTQCESLAVKFNAEIRNIPHSLPNHEIFTSPQNRLRAEVATRMIFSALVDADFLDTEAHYFAESRPVPPKFDAADLLQKLDVERRRKSAAAQNAKCDINEIRNSVFEQCVKAGKSPQGFYSLTVPTGGGKTLSAMAFALSHSAYHNLRRIIVVIPYLSIIEQNAAEYRGILDPDDTGIVIENHSAVSIASENEEATSNSEARSRNPLVLAAENWDAPIVITTSVQFLESLLANRPSRCRKLHNIARSIVIFDEIHSMPQNLLRPLLSVFRELQHNYRVSFLFSTATQPAFRRQFNLPNGFEADEITEIVADPPKIFRRLSRVKYEINLDQPVDFPRLANEISAHGQVLVVVNTRRHAFELFEAVRQRANDDNYHLSSAMCAEHRFDCLKTIRESIAAGKACRVISTQLVEAGVDLDFPIVYRALGPLDSIVQAAGRCNREGRLKCGIVKVFRPQDNTVPPGIYRIATERTAAILANLSDDTLAKDPYIFQEYFTQLYGNVDAGADIESDRARFNFQTVAANAKVIREEGIAVIVPYSGTTKDAMTVVNELRNRGDARLFSRNDLRRLQRFMVNLRPTEFAYFRDQRLVTPLYGFNRNGEPIGPSIWLLDKAVYNKRFGVLLEQRPAEEFII